MKTAIINYDDCIKACQDCIVQCQNCLVQMSGKESSNECPLCCALCIDACLAAIKFMVAQSYFAKQYIEICADVCEWCMEQCQIHDHEHCQQCAESCRICIVECRKLVA